MFGEFNRSKFLSLNFMVYAFVNNLVHAIFERRIQEKMKPNGMW